jgi:hypothetical protein
MKKAVLFERTVRSSYSTNQDRRKANNKHTINHYLANLIGRNEPSQNIGTLSKSFEA